MGRAKGRRLGMYKKAWLLLDKHGGIEPFNGGLAIFEKKCDAEFNKYFYKTTHPKVKRCLITVDSQVKEE